MFRLLSKEGEVGKDKIRELVELNEDEIDYIMHKLDIDQDNKVSLREYYINSKIVLSNMWGHNKIKWERNLFYFFNRRL